MCMNQNICKYLLFDINNIITRFRMVMVLMSPSIYDQPIHDGGHFKL